MVTVCVFAQQATSSTHQEFAFKLANQATPETVSDIVYQAALITRYWLVTSVCALLVGTILMVFARDALSTVPRQAVDRVFVLLITFLYLQVEHAQFLKHALTPILTITQLFKFAVAVLLLFGLMEDAVFLKHVILMKCGQVTIACVFMDI